MLHNYKKTNHLTITSWGPIFISLCVLSIALMNLSIAQVSIREWKLEKDDGDIKVYVIAVENTDIIKAKSVATLNASLEEIKKILDDIEHRHEWVPFLKKSSLLRQNSENNKIEYSVFSAPWPASDRDFVYSLEQTTNTSNQQVYEMYSVKISSMPENTAVNSNVTRIELIYHADPKGWLPNWIINIIQKVLPYKILKNLRDRLRSQTSTSMNNNRLSQHSNKFIAH